MTIKSKKRTQQLVTRFLAQNSFLSSNFFMKTDIL